jgi:hypothetical protein
MDESACAAPDAAEDRFEIEITDLHETHGFVGSRWSAPRSPLAPRLTVHGRGVRLGSAAMTVALALLVTLGGFAALRDPALALLASLRGHAHPATQRASNAQIQAAAANDSLWAALNQRPLRLSRLDPGSPCPVMPGHRFSQAYGVGLGMEGGAIYALAPGAADGTLRYTHAGAFAGGGGDWGGQVVLWAINLDFGGPVLVRGRQLDGHNELRFNGGLDEPEAIGNPALAPPILYLRLLPSNNGDGLPWGTVLAYTRVRAPGCYAYQVDGRSFSYIIIFQAVPDQ